MKQVYYNNLIDFNVFYETIKNCTMPVQVAYKLSKIHAFVEAELPFFQDKINQLLLKYAELDNDTGRPKVDPETSTVKIRDGNIDKFTKEYDELKKVPIDYDLIIDLTYYNLTSIDMTPSLMDKILPFINELKIDQGN